MVAPRSISSNCTSLAYAVEREGVTPSALPWQLLDPAGYTGDFGATPNFITAETVGSGRAPRKGRPSGKTVGAQFETYQRQYELQPFLPGFFINQAIETANTNTYDHRNTTPTTLTAVSGTGYTGTNFTNANGWDDREDALLIFANGFSTPANNGVKTLATVTSATAIAVAGTEAEASPPTGAFLEVCGYTSTDTEPALTVSGARITLASGALKSGGPLEQPVGTFIHIGGDSTNSRYPSDANTGWARIREVTATGVICDLSTFEPVAQAGTGITTLQVFVPTRIFKDDIECNATQITTYAFERRLGKNDDQNPHEQCQLVTGSFPNQLDLAMPTEADVKATMQFMSRESYRRDGKTNDTAPWSGTNRLGIDKTDFYDTTYDIKHALIYRHDATVANQTSIIGLITDGTFTLNNNGKSLKGWGVSGAWDINPGYLMVDTSVNAVFTDIELLNIAEDGIDAGFFVVFGRKNAGFILDVPLVTIQTSALTLDNNEAVMVRITKQGNESAFGYAASFQYFDYLPTLATQRKRPTI